MRKAKKTKKKNGTSARQKKMGTKTTQKKAAPPPQPSADELFEHAEAVRLSARALTPLSVQGPWHTVSQGVLGLLALELYLKSFIREEKKSYPNTHKIKSLFSALEAPHQLRIRQLAAPFIEGDALTADKNWGPPTSPKMAAAKAYQIAQLSDFDKILKFSDDAFVAIRYRFEKANRAKANWGAGSILEATRQAILELHPEWATLLEAAYERIAPGSQTFMHK